MGMATNFLISGTGPAMAAVFTNPMDVARVNMQINGEAGAKATYSNTFDCIGQLWRQGGASAVQRGLTTAFVREFAQNVPRIGLYEPLMMAWRQADDTHGDGTSDPLAKRFVVAATCGATAVSFLYK